MVQQIVMLCEKWGRPRWSSPNLPSDKIPEVIEDKVEWEVIL
jgi:hypothetical protein